MAVVGLTADLIDLVERLGLLVNHEEARHTIELSLEF